jgi:hypothetical protein
MKKVPDALINIQIDDQLIHEWLDSFYPSTKTFATHLVFNLLPRHGYDSLVETGYGEILSVMCDHFFAFLQVKVSEVSPGYVLSGLLPGTRELLD